MADEKLTFVTALQGPKHPNYQEIYSNTTKVGVSPWDLRIIYGHMVEQAPGQQVVEDLVTIVMSPQHAKVLYAHWARAIKTYEDRFGVIPDLTELASETAREGKN